ncbi:MAG: heparan-alpha-glucosaminide N-acetyltransferase [Cyclobacteriaceae bacterium]
MENTSNRLISLDALRGFTIALMILVNDPGDWGNVYWPLLHAKWHGITITDFVFPFFVFIVGVSVVLATKNQLAKGVEKSTLRKKVVFRSIKIFALGLFLALFPEFDFANIRIPGVLQRIAIVYAVCGLMFLSTDWKAQFRTALVLLVGYYLLMMLVPVPDVGAGVLEPGQNLAAWIDSLLVPGRLYQVTWDPEGLLSTLPAIATGISGMLAGYMIISIEDQHKKVMWMMVVGFVCVLIGYLWHVAFPINKNLWSSSYVMFTSGWAFMALATSILFIDVLGYRKGIKFGIIYGSNAITIYVLAGILPNLTSRLLGLQGAFMDGLTGIGLEAKFVSMLWAILFVLICYIPAYIMYKKKIFIKV